MNQRTLFDAPEPDNPFDDAGDLLVARVVEQGQRAYGSQWPAIQTQMITAHSDGRAQSANGLRHDEALSILHTIETERPDVFSMTRNWKEPKKKKRNASPPVRDEEWQGIPLEPKVVTTDHHVFIRRDSLAGNPYHGSGPDVVAKYRRHLAQRIMDGLVTHSWLVDVGNAGGKDGVRLAFEDGDVSGPTFAKCVDSALRFNERQFTIMIRQHFGGKE